MPEFRLRKHKRAIANTQVLITLKDGTRKKVDLKNISERGVCIMTNFHLEINEEAEVSILFPFFSDFVDRKSQVVWCRGMGRNIWKLALDFGSNRIDLSHYFKRKGAV